ncbi:hypothetical protein ASG89_29630 [Paenibacillus sp. Soil766]|uniref:hypothetical protein n=1 Tax=Paenibacillus sp. Soil766 TaxID=1736404 RepID=UPI00070EDFB9|nr:hypothetical protein [Paenibacillus sp. Soil766]KRE97766.1 hypothetical protein ASG89_29630 [Paenibacillus sp. Soil766]
MKRVASAFLASVVLLGSISIGPSAYASADIPLAYLDGYTAGSGEGDDAVIKIRLDSPATETTAVSYRTQFGSAHNQTTALTSGKFMDPQEGTVTFSAGESYKEVTIPH